MGKVMQKYHKLEKLEKELMSKGLNKKEALIRAKEILKIRKEEEWVRNGSDYYSFKL